MISFAKLLDPLTPQRVCLRAHELFLEGFESVAVVERLKQEGFTERVAARAATFLPSAFARVHYEKEGMTFPAYFFPGMAAHAKGRFLRFENEPVFRAAMQLAEQVYRDGDSTQVWRFIEFSAEHRGIAEARARGLTPIGSSLLIYEF
jgi:hypothetical protein